jgi:hypothetical protein
VVSPSGDSTGQVFATLIMRMGFSEATGVRALSFRDVSMGEAAGLPLDRAGGNAEGAKLPRRYVAEKTSPRDLELKKSPSSLRKYDLCKALIVFHTPWLFLTQVIKAPCHPGIAKRGLFRLCNRHGASEKKRYSIVFSFFTTASDFIRLTASIRAGNTFSLISPATITATTSSPT